MRARLALVAPLLAWSCAEAPAELALPSEDPTLCAARFCGEGCGSGRVCTAGGACVDHAPDCTPPAREGSDGFDDVPGSGLVFALSSIAVGPRGGGFDIDGGCSGDGCADNLLYQLGQLGNDQLRQAMLGGDLLYLLEISGVDDTLHDPSVTVKVYLGRDADDPFFPANNFGTPPGETTCCTFLVDGRLMRDGQALARIPARISHGRLLSLDRGSVPLSFGFMRIGGAPDELAVFRLERSRLRFQLAADGATIDDGLIGGAIPMADLAMAHNPYCRTLNNLCQRQIPNSSMLDMIASIFQPDVDLDQDGLETLTGGPNGRIDRCIDGCGTACPPVPPVVPDDAESCARDPHMQDGYSIAFTFSGVKAKIAGIHAGL